LTIDGKEDTHPLITPLSTMSTYISVVNFIDRK